MFDRYLKMNHYSRLDPHQYHGHAPNEPRGTNLEAMLEEFMESQRQSNRDLGSKLEFLRYDLNEDFWESLYKMRSWLDSSRARRFITKASKVSWSCPGSSSLSLGMTKT